AALPGRQVGRNLLVKARAPAPGHFEDPAFMDWLGGARRESSWRPLEMITHGLRLAKDVTTLAGFGALLSQLSPWAVLALALAGLPFFAEMRYGALQYAMKSRRTPRERQAHYLTQLLTSDWHAKEVKLFAHGTWLLARHRALHEEFYREDKSFGTRRGLAVALLGDVSIGVFYLIYAFVVVEAATGA